MDSDVRTRRVILRMFRAKMDTLAIAKSFNVAESQIANELNRAREEEYGHNLEFALSAKRKSPLEGRER